MSVFAFNNFILLGSVNACGFMNYSLFLERDKKLVEILFPITKSNPLIIFPEMSIDHSTEYRQKFGHIRFFFS